MIATPFRATGFSGIPLRLLVGRDTSGNPLPVGSELEAAGYDATLRNLGSGEVAAEEWDGIVCESLEAARRVLALPGMRLPVIAICGTAAEAAEAEAAGAGGSVPRNDLRRLAVVVAHAVAEAKIGRVLDTTERELAERDRSYRLLFDRAADGIVIWHEDGRVLDVNPVFCELTGYDRAECLRLDITRFIPPSDLEREPVGGAELRAGKRKFRKRRLLRRNGETFSVEIASRKLKGSAYISIVRDITAREAAERTIRYQLSLLQATLEATRDGIAVVDRDDKLAAWNRRTAATFGLGEEEFRAGDSRRVFARMAERVTEPALFAAVLAQSGEKAHLRLSGILQTLDGRTIEYSRSPQRLGGEIIGRVWSFHDVTTRKHAVEALLASEKKYRSIVENIPEAIVVIDRAGRIRYVTPNCLPISGYTAEEWMAMSDAQRAATAHPEDLPALRRAFAALFEQGVRYDVEYRCRHRDGRWIWIHARGLRTYEHEGVLCADMIVSDITSRRKADLALREMAAVLENAVEGIARADRAGICVHANAACAAMLGRKPRDIIGQQWMAAVHPDDRERVTEGHRSMLAGQKREMEIRALAADGSLRNLRLLLIPLRDEAGEPAGHYCF
ncbi:MAG TPA: PAS domain S-box protein, partial [Thermoanaerobaculia bacterium]|nr:PAS domain S-box protein [Thermoanaerobaculia bacterium]